MANIEEKVKAFLSDEKKMEALGKDSAFIEKMSGGTATIQDISKKFGELGLELTPGEAEAVGETTKKILTETPIAKIDSVSLDAISGGVNALALTSNIAFTVGDVGTVGALGCNVAGLVCRNKAMKAASAGDTVKSAKYSSVAYNLNIISIACGGVGTAGFGVGLGFGIADLATRERCSSGSKDEDFPLFEDGE